MRKAMTGFIIGIALCLNAGTVFRVANAAPAQGTEVDRIEITGVTVFPSEEIQDELEIAPGDKPERVKIIRTIENLQSLYKFHGYEQISVQSKSLKMRGDGGRPENVLEFIVKEGKPTRVASIRFTPEKRDDDSFDRYWQRLQSELAYRTGIKVGDILDQEKINAGKRALQDALASEEYIGARVEDVKVLTTGAPETGATQSVKDNSNRWVALDFRLDLGDKVTFGFRGNQVFTASKLSSLVEDQRVLGFGKDYVGAIRSRIEDEYRSMGYAQAKVSPLTFENYRSRERHVTYMIVEGPRVSIESIQFDGNLNFSNSELLTRFREKASVLIQNGYYVERDIQKAAELLIEWLKSKGYLNAKLITINRVYNILPKHRGSAHSVRLIIYIYEGDQTTVGSIRLNGIHAISSEQAIKLLQVKEGEPLNLFAFSEGMEALRREYWSLGYLSASIQNEDSDQVVRYSEENRVADIEIQMIEGPLFKVSRIAIDGLGLTREHVLRRELRFREGDIITEPGIYESEARLRRLGIFSYVNIRAMDDQEKQGYKVVRVSVQEGTPGIVAGGAGFRNDLGIRVFGQSAYTNLGGRNQTLSLNAVANRRFEDYRFVEYQARLGYLWPWFLGIPELSFRPSISVTGTQYIKFDATTISAAATIERPILQRPILFASLTYSLERILQFHAQFPQDNQGLRIGTLTPALRLDMRDHPLAPTSGLFALSSFEYAAPWLYSQQTPYRVGYYRLQFRSDYFVPVTRNIVWYFSFRSGFERNNESPVDDPNNPDTRIGGIPLIKQFSIGGAGSLRGYKEQELNFQDKAIFGTLSYVNYRTQVDLPLMGSLKFGPFLDAANLRVDSFSFGALKYGTGFGFHYQTPVGPVNLDWGFKLNPDGGETHRFYFSIGVI